MRGMNYTRATSSSKAAGPNDDVVEEALAKQAALRPAKTAPKVMPITPTLPRIPKPHKRRRRAD